uniref:Uncharacterized protein n=1 Tax=Plectus sambesii TaxID=2011161 RepID=A0A914UMB2_9BILA
MYYEVEVLALVATAVSASNGATAAECLQWCPSSVYECLPTDSGLFSCQMSAWLVVALVFIGISLVIGIPIMCFGMYMCGMSACVGTYSDPRRRRRCRCISGRRNKYWRRPWQIFRREGQPAFTNIQNKPVTAQKPCRDPAKEMRMISGIESGVHRLTAITDLTENDILQMPMIPSSKSPATVSLNRTQTTVSVESGPTELSPDHAFQLNSIDVDVLDSRRSSKHMPTLSREL